MRPEACSGEAELAAEAVPQRQDMRGSGDALLQPHQLYPAVLRASFLRGVVRDRPVLAEALRLQPPRHHSQRDQGVGNGARARSEEHTSELQSPMHISYADFCLKHT